MKRKCVIILLLFIICLTSVNQIYAVNADEQTFNDAYLDEDPMASTMDDLELSDDSLVEESIGVTEPNDDFDDCLAESSEPKESENPKSEAMDDYFGEDELNNALYQDTCNIKTAANDFAVESKVDAIEEANDFAVENKLEAISKEYTITQGNFYRYFTRDGVLKEEYSNSVLVFDGDFDGYGIISISSPAYVKGPNANFINTVFHLNADNITLDGISMHLTDSFEDNEYAGILIDRMNITVSNVFMNISACDKKALGIFSNGVDYDTSNLKLLNNTIIFNATGNGSYYWGIALTYTDNASISCNNVTCSLPLRSVNWDGGFYGGISSDSVAGIAIQSSNDLKFENNYVKVIGNSNQGYYPTLDAVLIHSCDNAILSNNTILEEDFSTPMGTDNYLYALDVYLSNNVSVLSNQIHLNTTGGKLAAGTAYGIQISGPFEDFTIAYNNISTINFGPNIGIYSQNYEGNTSLNIYSNFINVTGLAGEHNWALVAGIEVQDSDDLIWNNTIIVNNIGDYDDNNNVYGISYSQNTKGNHTYNIQYNNVTTNGRYAVSLSGNSSLVVDSIIANNVLNSKDSSGDSAVRVGKGMNNLVINNTDKDFMNAMSDDELFELLRNRTNHAPMHYSEDSNGTGFTDDKGNGTAPWNTHGSSGGSSNGNGNHGSDVSGNGTNPHSDAVLGSDRDTAPGIGGDVTPSISAASSADSGSSAADPNAYEINEKDNLAVKSVDYLQLGLICVIALMLLIVGYKRQKDKEEEE